MLEKSFVLGEHVFEGERLSVIHFHVLELLNGSARSPASFQDWSLFILIFRFMRLELVDGEYLVVQQQVFLGLDVFFQARLQKVLDGKLHLQKLLKMQLHLLVVQRLHRCRHLLNETQTMLVAKRHLTTLSPGDYRLI